MNRRRHQTVDQRGKGAGRNKELSKLIESRLEEQARGREKLEQRLREAERDITRLEHERM